MKRSTRIATKVSFHLNDEGLADPDYRPLSWNEFRAAHEKNLLEKIELVLLQFNIRKRYGVEAEWQGNSLVFLVPGEFLMEAPDAGITSEGVAATFFEMMGELEIYPWMMQHKNFIQVDWPRVREAWAQGKFEG
jgi:hypothetical protein